MVFAENGASVGTVMIGASVVFDDGKLYTIDETALRSKAQEAASRLNVSDAGVSAGPDGELSDRAGSRLVR
jgi:hypothetical protein